MRGTSISLILVASMIFSLILATPSYAIPPNPYAPLPYPVSHTMTVRIALVGISQIDKDRLLWNLEPQITPSIQVSHNPQGFSSSGDYGISYGNQFTMKYDITTVSNETLSAMKSYLKSIAEIQKVPNSLQWKTYWSADSDPNSYSILDAVKTEDWLNSHISELGGIPDDGYLIIIANVSDISTLYHYYSIAYRNLDKASTKAQSPGTPENSQSVNWMFSWGGHYRFYFLDLSAGDPKFDYSRVGHVPIQSFGIRPWWGEIRYNAQSLTDAVSDYVSETVRNLFLPSYTYATTFAQSYEIVIQVFDETGRVTDANVGDYLSTTQIQKAFQKLVPYATWSSSLTAHRLSDDPGLENALADSILYTGTGAGSSVFYDYRLTYSYLQSHLQQYAPTSQDALVLPVFEFVFKGTGRFATVWEERIGSGPGGVAGMSLGDMVIIGSSETTIKSGLTQSTIHELGHLVGLMHPHSYGYVNDYVASAMSYLTFEYEFSQFDADAIQRAHADSLFSQVQGAIQETANMTFHNQAQDLLNQARSAYATALSSYSKKDYGNAVKALVNVPKLLDQTFTAEAKTLQSLLGQTYVPELSTTSLQQANTTLSSAIQAKNNGNIALAYRQLATAGAWISDANYAKSQAQVSANSQLPIVLLIGLTIGIAGSFLIFRRATSPRRIRSASPIHGNEFYISSSARIDGHALNGGSRLITANPASMAEPENQPVTVQYASDVRSSRTLLREAAFLVICAMVALLGAFQEYFTVGEFFALRDVLHHEVIEVTVLAFGIGAFSAAVWIAISHRARTKGIIQTPIPLPRSYAYKVTARPRKHFAAYTDPSEISVTQS